MKLIADISVGSGSGLIHSLLAVLIVGICIGIVYAVGRWFILKLTQSALVMTVWNGFFILVGAIIVINFLMSLTGHPFIQW